MDGAITVYRRVGQGSLRRGNAAVELARLLARHDRYDDAIEVMRTPADAPGGAEDWIVDVLCTLYAEQGRPQDALAWLDGLKARRGKEEWELFWIRLPLMAACGRVDEAVELTRAHPEGATSYAAEHVATLLADAERRLSRRITVVLPDHLAALGLAARSDVVALVPAAPPDADPSPLTEQATLLGLRLLDIPLPLPPVTIGMAWRPRHTSDGAHRWLRSAVRRTLRARPSDGSVKAFDSVP